MSAVHRTFPVVFAFLFCAQAAYPQRTPVEKLRPCESLSESAAVFVGVAGTPVVRQVQLPDHPPLPMKLTPITVERAYVGVSTDVVYLTPLGIERYGRPGQRYLVYGRHYRPPDIVMASPGIGAKEIETAAADLAFLETVGPNARGGTIGGVVQLKDLVLDGRPRDVSPLASIPIQVRNDGFSTEIVTGPDGRFTVAVPAGTYDVITQLPPDLVVWRAPERIQTTVSDGGCAVLTIDVAFNGRVRGTLRGPDGQPLASTSVDLIPSDVAPDSTGHVRGMGSVGTNAAGEFEFTGRPPGRYLLGVSLYNAPNRYGPSYPRTYYPGTPDRDRAMPIVVERGGASEGFDFSISTVLAKGELEVTVEGDRAGTLKVCFVQLADLVRGRSVYDARPGVPLRFPVVDGQQYEVHAHLEYPGSHLESEPFEFTATTGRTSITLRLDAPRSLHLR